MSHAVSIVMCAYTEARWDDLLSAVASLRGQTHAPAEIIVVIDHNTVLFERARAIFAQTEASLVPVMVIENSEARGLSGARNSGIAVAHGDIIAFMDEDAAAAADWLARLAEPYDDPQVMGVGGAIHPHWLAGRPGWFPPEFDWVVGCTYRGMPETRAQVRNLIGCNMSFRRGVADRNGGFRVGIGRIGTLPVGCEETEYCIRAQQRWPHTYFLYEPAAQVFHNVPAARGTWGYFASRCYAEGISKALIGQFVGTTSSLSSERAYVVKTLPQGVLRGLGRGIRHLDINGFTQATAIIVGLGLTTLGYVKTRFQTLIAQRAASRTSASLRYHHQEEHEAV